MREFAIREGRGLRKDTLRPPFRLLRIFIFEFLLDYVKKIMTSTKNA